MTIVLAFVLGLRETMLSSGQLDKEGCSTKISWGQLEVYSPSGQFLFSVFQHAGWYFLDSSYCYGPVIQRTGTVLAMVLQDASYDNSAELWHCQMGMPTGLVLRTSNKLTRELHVHKHLNTSCRFVHAV